MPDRKWLVRSLYLAILAALTGGGLILYSCLRPEFILSELTQQIKDKFNDVDVEIQSAQLRLLGDIVAIDLRLTRRDDPTGTPFLLVPTAIFHHDRERLNDGKLVVRKIELLKPRLRIVCELDGRWNFTSMIKPPKDNEPAPVMVLHEATIVVVDRRRGETPIVEWKDVEATVVNDPVAVFAFQISGVGAPSGPFAVDGHFDKRSGLSGSLDLPAITVDNSLARVAQSVNPDIAEYLKPLTGKASVHLDLSWQTSTSTATYHDLRVQLKEGRYQHPNLPFPLEQIDVSLQSKNGNITLERATAQFGTGAVSVKMVLPKEPICAPGTVPLALPTVDGPTPEDRNLLSGPTQWLMDFENRLRSLDVVVTTFPVTAELIAKIPGRAQLINDMFKPSGPLSFTYAFRRDEGGWTKNLVLQPEGMEAVYRGFPYPLKNVRGTIRHSATESATDNIKVDLLVDGAGTTGSIKGTIKGAHPDGDVDLTMEAKGVTLDKLLIDAMPDDNPALLRKMHAAAVGDVVGTFRHNVRTRREYGPEIYDNLFTIQLRRASLKYDAFPYPLEDLTGTLIVRSVPERPTQLPSLSSTPMKPQEASDSTTLEFKGFQATHNGARIFGGGRKDPAPGGSILNLSIEADSLALDADMRKALAAIRMESSWVALDPSGRTNCAIRVKLFTKTDPDAPLNAAEDLEMSMGFNGGAIRPNFFAYQLNDVMGRVSYAKGRIALLDFKAAHASSQLTLPYTEVLFRPGGGYWADVREARLNPLVIDNEFLQALPPGLKSSCEDLELSGPMSLHVTRMVVDEQPGPYIPRYLPGAARGVEPDEDENRQLPYKPVAPVRPLLPTIYWDGCLTLQGASMKTGVPWEDIHGKFASWGLYKGDRMGAVRGNVVFDKATIAKQPAEAITAQLRVDPRQPEVLSIPAIKGKMYDGDLGGEGYVVFDSPTRYGLQLNAARVRLSKIAQHYHLPEKSHLEGLASAQIYLANRFDERTGLPVLQGGGTIDVPKARLLNLPVLLNLVKVVKLRVPDETGFEEAHALFYIRGDRVKVGQLDLIGNAISLGGEGEMTLDGKNIQFEFYPVWTKLKEMFPLPGDWPGVLSKRFMKIKVSGDIDKPLNYKAEPVPGIVEPVKRLVERLK